MKKQLLSIGLIALAPMAFFGQTNQLFTTAGPHNFTVPTGVLSVKVECVGGGGAGGRVTPSNVFDDDAAGGGGGGGRLGAGALRLRIHLDRLAAGAAGRQSGRRAAGAGGGLVGLAQCVAHPRGRDLASSEQLTPWAIPVGRWSRFRGVSEPVTSHRHV